MESYRSIINYPKPTNDYLYLNHDGTTISTYDLRDYIQPDFFTNVISTLTDGRTDMEFVNEVINLRDENVAMLKEFSQ